MHKKKQLGRFLGIFLGPSLKTGLSFMKNVLKQLAKSVLIPLGLTSTASAIDAATHKKMFEPDMTTIIVFNEKMNNIMKIINLLKNLVY